MCNHSKFLCIFLTLAAVQGVQAEVPAVTHQLWQKPPAVGQCVDLEVDLTAPPAWTLDAEQAGGRLHYPMVQNNVAEGWSWSPEATPKEQDFYRFKYLPLGSSAEERGDYRAEDMIGETQRMAVRWRYDYFLAFDNYAGFAAQGDEDDAGFELAWPSGALPAHPRLSAQLCLTAPPSSESTTFWKATHAQPVDFTLKKRYLVGKLTALTLWDADSGQRLASLMPTLLKPQNKSSGE